MTAIDTVVETIARVARDEDADLIPMSTHALTGPRRALPGGVAVALPDEQDRQGDGHAPETGGAHRGRSGR